MFQYNTIQSEIESGNIYKFSWLVIQGKNVMPSFIVEDFEGNEVFCADSEIWLKEEFYKQLIYSISTKNFQTFIEMCDNKIDLGDIYEIKDMFDEAIKQNVI